MEFLWAALQRPRPEDGMPSLPQLVGREMGLEWGALPPADPRREEIIQASRRVAQDLAAGRFPPPGGPRSEQPEWHALARCAADLLVRRPANRDIPPVFAPIV